MGGGGGEGEDDEDEESEDTGDEGEEGVPGELEYVDAEEGYEVGGPGGGEGVAGGGGREDDESSSSSSDEDESESSDEDEDEEDPNAVHSTESKPNSTINQKRSTKGGSHTLTIPSLTNGLSASTSFSSSSSSSSTSTSNSNMDTNANGSPIHVDGSGQQTTPIPLSTPNQANSVLSSVPPSSTGPAAGPSPTSLVAPTPPPGASASASASAPPPAGETSSTATVKPAKGKEKAGKGKGTKKHRTPSPSPPPPVPPPPLTTVRLELKLGGPSNYEVDVARRAKETGQRPWSPEPPVVVVPEVVVEEKKSIAQEYYDTSDPFIDDSELAVDQRTYFAQTKQQGFYVSSGEVALLKDPSHKSPKKPKSKKPGLGGSLSVASGSGKGKAGQGGRGNANGGDGTRDSPIALVELGGGAGVPGAGGAGMYGAGVSVSAPPGGVGRTGGSGGGVEEEGDEKAGMKRKRYITVVEGGKKRKIVNVNSFHPDLQAAIDVMKASIAAESWEQKGKFPPALKPKLGELAVKAIKLDEYDDHFFNLMPFTMTKLIKRTVYADHVGLLLERQDELLKQLEDLAKAGFARAEEEYQKSLLQWTARQEKFKLEAGGGGGAPTGSNAPTRHPTEERDKDAMDVEMPLASQPAGEAKKDGEKKEKDHPPPSRRYRLTEQMRGIIWDLVLLSNEACRLENEKNSCLEQGGRKVLYQKIVAAFPEGWMSSGQISRDVSAMKKRFEKEAMEMEES
ncbi:hypothetical protein FA13DRAFT_1754027 [Coprinellus micaceus]|uniref:Ubinuclein middle domain-containing protein n=1 Tax=Coprinellus micaceus TaxID=71717 RepID=A0A4Y7TIJ0_COPMI|nr:hypothetical protein FA13DRAFT_1754027 [Coprinellus micaceus]